MIGFVLHCTVCSAELETRQEWLSHLLGADHQVRARQDCVRKWDHRMKESCIVLFASFPVASENVLQFFSRGKGGEVVLVSDFVWWPKRPRVGLVVFESSERLNEVYWNKGGGPQVEIDGQVVQFKKAVDFMDLEWAEFLPEPEDSPSRVASNAACGSDYNKDKEMKDDQSGTLSKSKSERKPLTDVFAEMREKVEIPDGVYSEALEIVRKLEKIFGRLASQEGSSCKAYIFRHWYLKLSNMGTNELLIFLDTHGLLERGGNLQEFNLERLAFFPKELEKIFRSQHAQSILPGVMPYSGRTFCPQGTLFKNGPNGLEFCIFTNSICVTEVQTCRLLQYLVTFDLRAKPLITLVHYWAKINKVQLCHGRFAFKEPYTLEWLVICFLCNKKLVPTPRQVAQRPHQSLLDKKHGMDIGYFEDPEFALEWSRTRSLSLPDNDTNEFVLSVLTLAQEFFEFCSTWRNGSWLVNTRDGEVINQSDFLDKQQGVHWHSNLTPKEVSVIRSFQFIDNAVVNVGRVPIVVLQPLRPTFGFSFCNETFRQTTVFTMLFTKRQLQHFLNRQGQKGSPSVKNFESFKKVLRVTPAQMEKTQEVENWDEA